jgi:hypothetical protein
MDIKGLDYNTQRDNLVLPEYGREVHKMVEHAIGLPNKQERLRCANRIIRVMLTKVPHIRENADYKHTLWDHLFLICRGQLDIDWPYDMTQAQKINNKPQPMPIPQNRIKLRHYGRLIEELTAKLKDMPACEQRNALVRRTANQMKRDLAQWGHGSVENEKVADDIARLTDGAIQIDINQLSRRKRNNSKDDSPKKASNKRKK